MKGYECKICDTELEYHQIHGGIRLLHEHDGQLYYHAYCPKCDVMFKEKKKW